MNDLKHFNLRFNVTPEADSTLRFIVAHMAHLLVHDLATPLWETVHSPVDAADRPVCLEQTDGVGAAKKHLETN